MDHFDPDGFQHIHDSGEQLVSVHMNVEKPILHNGQWPTEKADIPFELAGKVP